VRSTLPHNDASGLRAANLGLRFLLELTTLAALAYLGFHTGTTTVADVLLGVGVPLVAAVVWGVFAAPNSGRRRRGAALIAVQMAFFAAGVASLAASGHPWLAALLAVVVVVNAVLLHHWRDT
jgi:Protein of unknown function (DUF2568)